MSYAQSVLKTTMTVSVRTALTKHQIETLVWCDPPGRFVRRLVTKRVAHDGEAQAAAQHNAEVRAVAGREEWKETDDY